MNKDLKDIEALKDKIDPEDVALVVQANGKEDIQTLEDMYDITKKDDFISYENIDMYEKDKTINAMGYGYDFYVYDMGLGIFVYFSI